MRRFFLVSLVAFVATSALIWLLMARWRERAIATTGRDLGARAQLVAYALDRTLQNRIAQAFTYASLPSLRAFAASDDNARPARLATAHFELRSIVASDPLVRAVSIVDTHGIVILTTDNSTEADWGTRDFVREGMLGHLFASVPGRDFGEAVQFYSAPILDNFGEVAGVLVVRVAAQEIWSALTKTENALLLDDNGVRIGDTIGSLQLFFAISPPTADQFARAISEKRYGAEIPAVRVIPFPELATQLKTSRAAPALVRDPNGIGYLSVTRPLETNPWTLVLLTQENASLGAVNVGYWEAFGWGALSGILLATIVYFALK